MNTFDLKMCLCDPPRTGFCNKDNGLFYDYTLQDHFPETPDLSRQESRLMYKSYIATKRRLFTPKRKQEIARRDLIGEHIWL